MGSMFYVPPSGALPPGPAETALLVTPTEAWLLIICFLCFACAVLGFLSANSRRAEQPRPTPDPPGGHRVALRQLPQSAGSDDTAYRSWYAA